MTTSVTVRVPAKINLQLAVGPLRGDGYHDLVTVFHAVSLFDEVTVAVADPAAGANGADAITVTGEGAQDVPADGDNLALRAVSALRDALARRAGAQVATTGVRVTIDKEIPVAGGMAGGSADAAAALVGANALWQAGLSGDQLSAVAAQLGSDVPFALLGGTAVGEGRGERLTPLPGAEHAFHWVLAYAAGHLSTPQVYKTLDDMRDGARVAAPALSEELMAALRDGDPARLGQALRNDLQAAALALFPALARTLEAGREAGALGGLVSGSGPTCFFLAGDRRHAAALADRLSAGGACRAVATASGPAAGATVIEAGS